MQDVAVVERLAFKRETRMEISLLAGFSKEKFGMCHTV
jgi:hypothetical protein